MARTILNIPSGTTKTVAAGETQDTATVTNAGTFENAGTQTVGGLDLSGTGVDIDATSATLLRVRELASTATDVDASSGSVVRFRPLTGDSTDIDVATSDLFAARAITGTATDIDASTATLDRQRDLTGTSADIDAITGTLKRIRALASTATDVDAADAELKRLRRLASQSTDIDASTGDLKRIRDLFGESEDIDSSIGALLVLIVPQSTRPVGTIREILAEIPVGWKNDPPNVQNYWDVAQQERTPGADQPARVYVWQPASESHDRFSLDTRPNNPQTDDTTTVECLIYSLDAQEVLDYADDLRNILQFYYDDNKDLTNFTTIEPVNTNDYREQNQKRQTDAYVMSVEIELRSIQPAADLAGRVD